MIYLVEDEESIRNLLLYTLSHTGFEAKGFPEASGFWEALKEQCPKLILLDIMLPGEDGLMTLKKLREKPETKSIPVMMLTAKGTEYDKVLGLDLGADDYLAKPFGMMELVARIRSLLRRSVPEQERDIQEEYRMGELYLNVPRHVILAGGREVTATLKEFDVLLYLLRNRGMVLTRDQIMNEVWGYDFDGESRTVDVHIRSLRSKLQGCENMIETVRGVGYKIVRQD